MDNHLGVHTECGSVGPFPIGLLIGRSVDGGIEHLLSAGKTGLEGVVNSGLVEGGEIAGAHLHLEKSVDESARTAASPVIPVVRVVKLGGGSLVEVETQLVRKFLCDDDRQPRRLKTVHQLEAGAVGVGVCPCQFVGVEVVGEDGLAVHDDELRVGNEDSVFDGGVTVVEEGGRQLSVEDGLFLVRAVDAVVSEEVHRRECVVAED